MATLRCGATPVHCCTALVLLIGALYCVPCLSEHATNQLVDLNTTRTVRVGYMATRSFYGRPYVGGFVNDLIFRASQEFWSEKNQDGVDFQVIYGEASPSDEVPAKVRCAEVAHKLIQADVDIVFGPAASECAIPAAAVLGAAGVPQISPTTTSQALSNKTLYPTFFRIPASDAFQAALLARLVGSCDWTKVGVIATTDVWGTGLLNSLRPVLALNNATIAHTLLFPQGIDRENLTQLLTEYKKTSVSSVNILISLREDSINCLHAAIAADMAGPGWTWLVTNGVTLNPSLTEDLLAPFTGMVGIVPLGTSGPFYDDFSQYKDRFGYREYTIDTGVPSASAAYFDTTTIIHFAVNTAPSWNGTAAEKRQVLLHQLRTYSSPQTGVPGAALPRIYFNEHQDGPAVYQVVNAVDGRFRVVADSLEGLLIPTSVKLQWSTGAVGLDNCPSQEPPVEPTESNGRDNTAVLIAVIVSLSVVVVIVALVVVFVIRRNRSLLQPHDFSEDLKDTGLDTELLLEPEELKRSSITLGEKLGSGYYGDVFKATLDQSASSGLPVRPVAVKTCREHATAADVSMLLKEAAYMAQFQGHANVVTLIGVVTRGQPVYLVMEYCEHGSLDTYLQTTFQRLQLSVPSKIRMGLDIAEGMCFISSKGAIHRDLACRNILVTLNFTCKITDFGLARNEAYYTSTTQALPIRWSAPETLNDGMFSTASDVWSFGVVMCEIFLDGRIPYPELSNEHVRLGLQCGDLRHPQVPGMPDEVYALLTDCWAEDPHERPTFPMLRQSLIKLVHERSNHGLNRLRRELDELVATELLI
eukprot:m.104163 g.104163  ORF g.104163 m.104163 type:complete len:813 (-) comp15067_c4_seq2:148-2586(-)